MMITDFKIRAAGRRAHDDITSIPTSAENILKKINLPILSYGEMRLTFRPAVDGRKYRRSRHVRSPAQATSLISIAAQVRT